MIAQRKEEPAHGPSRDHLLVAAETLRGALRTVLGSGWRLTAMSEAELGIILQQLSYALDVTAPRTGELPAGVANQLAKLAAEVRTSEEQAAELDAFYASDSPFDGPATSKVTSTGGHNVAPVEPAGGGNGAAVPPSSWVEDGLRRALRATESDLEGIHESGKAIEVASAHDSVVGPKVSRHVDRIGRALTSLRQEIGTVQR